MLDEVLGATIYTYGSGVGEQGCSSLVALLNEFPHRH
jgi:hypothetical protein